MARLWIPNGHWVRPTERTVAADVRAQAQTLYLPATFGAIYLPRITIPLHKPGEFSP